MYAAKLFILPVREFVEESSRPLIKEVKRSKRTFSEQVAIYLESIERSLHAIKFT